MCEFSKKRTLFSLAFLFCLLFSLSHQKSYNQKNNLSSGDLTSSEVENISEVKKLSPLKYYERKELLYWPNYQ